MPLAAALALTAATVPCVQSFGLQEPVVLRRRRGAQRDRRARHGAPRRADPPHAADRFCVPGRLRRDLGAAAAQRLRVRVADLPGDPAQPATAVLGPEVPGAGGRRAAGAVGGAGRGLFREGLRCDFSRPAAHARCGEGARDRQLFARRHVFPGSPLSGRRDSPGLLYRRAGAGDQQSGRRRHAASGRRAMAVDRADRRKPQFL